jgi:hypothetical protein
MLKKYKHQLNQMYDQHPKLQDKFISVINHLINPEQFEAEWAVMCDEFGLHDCCRPKPPDRRRQATREPRGPAPLSVGPAACTRPEVGVRWACHLTYT